MTHDRHTTKSILLKLKVLENLVIIYPKISSGCIKTSKILKFCSKETSLAQFLSHECLFQVSGFGLLANQTLALTRLALELSKPSLLIFSVFWFIIWHSVQLNLSIDADFCAIIWQTILQLVLLHCSYSVYKATRELTMNEAFALQTEIFLHLIYVKHAINAFIASHRSLVAQFQTIFQSKYWEIFPNCRIKKHMGLTYLHLVPEKVAIGSQKCDQAGLHNANQSHLFVKVG